jgi:Tfp pilus assembly protein FimT
MIELVIVVMIMSILMAVAAPSFYDSLLFHRVESAARRVKIDLQLARNDARLKSATRSVTFSGASYTISGGVKSLDNPNVDYAVDLSASPYLMDAVVANFSNAAVVSFDGYGKPTSGGSIVLTAKNHTCTVWVDGTTGASSITSNHPHGGNAGSSL